MVVATPFLLGLARLALGLLALELTRVDGNAKFCVLRCQKVEIVEKLRAARAWEAAQTTAKSATAFRS